jgi:uncharacterized protein (TIGR03067 family)
MKRVAAMVAAVVVLFGVSLARGGDAKADLDKIQGTWKVESIKESKGGDPADKMAKDFVVTVKDDVMTITLASTKNKLVSYKLTLDPSKNPKTIDFKHADGEDKGKTERGIYKIEGDSFTFCVNDFDKDRPAAFATKDGTGISLVTLKRSK